MAKSFYQNLYSSEGVTEMDEVLRCVPTRVDADMNSKLDAPFTAKEVKSALFEMYPTKAPGPDGFPAHFFQRNWEVCGEEVTAAVLRVLKGQDSPGCINKTFIVLIPKVASPKELGQFRPISLCNVVYKIASKVAANRLKIILPEIISEEQSAFVPGRLITDNALVAFECFHSIKRNTKIANDFCAYKLDLSKAYDRVDWCYLQGALLKMGFHHKWVKLVMECVTSVSFCIRINGELTDRFKASRGLRQGDPLSPYLFLFVAEGMTKILDRAVYRQELKDLKICRSAPSVSHLLFADDSLLFFQANA
jgi:hypothetical protein